MANTPATTEHPTESGYYLCDVRRFQSGGAGWVAAEAALYWDGNCWWSDSLHTEDFDGIYSFKGPLTIRGDKPGRKGNLRRVEYSQ